LYQVTEGLHRIRIDGEIHIGKNVYIGSRCIFNPGIRVEDAIHVGAGSCVSKDLLEAGMYVAQPLRFIRNDIDSIKQRLSKVTVEGLSDIVYSK